MAAAVPGRPQGRPLAMDIQIVTELEPEERVAVARVLFDAFRHKYATLIGDQDTAVAVVCHSCTHAAGLYARVGGSIVGVVGLRSAESAFWTPRLSVLRRYLWFGRALVVYVALKVETARRVKREEIRVETLAVRADLRGQGIGSALLAAVEGRARASGGRRLSLDVVDTNPHARRLYERLGFRAVKTTWYGPLTRRAGFSASTRMRKAVTPA